MGKLPPSLGIPFLSNAMIPKNTHNTGIITWNNNEQPHTTKSHHDQHLPPATEELPAW